MALAGAADVLKSVTNNWPSQRLYPIIRRPLTVAGGAGLFRLVRSRPAAHRWLIASLFGAVSWSLLEAGKFSATAMPRP